MTTQGTTRTTVDHETNEFLTIGDFAGVGSAIKRKGLPGAAAPA